MHLCERILIFVWNILCLHSFPLPPPPPLPGVKIITRCSIRMFPAFCIPVCPANPPLVPAVDLVEVESSSSLHTAEPSSSFLHHTRLPDYQITS